MAMKMNVSMKVNMNMNVNNAGVFYNVLMFPIEPGDHSGAPMSNDCQACRSAQAHMRQLISSEYLLTTRIDAANMKKILSIFWLPRRPNQSRGGRRGSSSPHGFTVLSVGDAPRGMRWRPCVIRASARDGGPSCPPARE
jgi:hypothetical protein